MTRYAALGDSITLGIGDPVPAPGGGRVWRGWAALLADGLVDPDLHILASNGACAADIARDQLPRALALRPDLASVVFGGRPAASERARAPAHRAVVPPVARPARPPGRSAAGR